jgi:hypothetical protein
VCIALLEALETLFSKLVGAHGFAAIPTVSARQRSLNPCNRLTSLPARSTC